MATAHDRIAQHGIIDPLVTGRCRQRTGCIGTIEHKHVVRIVAPARVTGTHSGPKLVFLLVGLMFHDRATCPMHDKAWTGPCRQQAAMQADPSFSIGQQYLRPVITTGIVALAGQAGLHKIRQAKQLQGLIGHVRAKVEP